MQLTEAQSAQTAQSWSAEEELIINTIQQAESVPRAEDIRRMQRRKKASHLASFRQETVPAPGRLCRNPRCTRGDDHGPASLAHLRADARYCGAACKKAVQRKPGLRNQASHRQCLRGSKRGQIGSLLSPHQPEEGGAENASNRDSLLSERDNFEGRADRI